MSPEKGVLEYYEDQKRAAGELAAAEFAKALRQKFGDEPLPFQEGEAKPTEAKPTFEPEILFARRREVVSRFVKAAIKEEAHLIKPTLRGLLPERWVRGRNILGSYLLSNATQEAIGRIYGISRPSVNRTINSFIRYLRQSASPDLKEQFILPHKPLERKIRPSPLPPSEGKPIHPALREALSGVHFSFINPEARKLLIQAFDSGAHLVNPQGMNSDRWVNYRNIFGTYILSHATLDEVGKIYGISRERVRQINEEVLEKLYPKNKISLKKKPEYRPKEWLLVKDNLGSEIVDLLEQGLSADQIRSRFNKGQSRVQATKALKMLREMDFNIKRIKDSHGEYLRIQNELLREDLSDEEVQSFLDQINTVQGAQSLVATGVIIIVRDLLYQAGFHFRVNATQPFYDGLIKAGIPLGITDGITENIVQSGPQKSRGYYHFIAARYKQKAEKALKKNPNLARFLENPVKQISGPKTKIPNTTEIMKKGGILSFASIASEFRIGSGSKKIQGLKVALEGSNQIPLFEYGGTYYILEADLEKARSFVKAKLESTGDA